MGPGWSAHAATDNDQSGLLQAGGEHRQLGAAEKLWMVSGVVQTRAMGLCGSARLRLVYLRLVERRLEEDPYVGHLRATVDALGHEHDERAVRLREVPCSVLRHPLQVSS